MESFLKAFLEPRAACISLRKLPVCKDGIAESNIKVLQKVIFKNDVLVEFKAALRSSCSPESFTVCNEFVKKIIKRLCDLLSSDEDVRVKTEIFSCVFQSFAARCKEDDGVHVMQFFVVLSHILGMNAILSGNNNEVFDDGGSLVNVDNFQSVFQVDISSLFPESYVIFKELLLCLSKTSVTLNSPDFQLYNKWLHQLLKNLANSQPFQDIFMEIFVIVANIDLRLFEGNLDCIFSNILAYRFLDDNNFWESVGRFLEGALSTCTKFQRSAKYMTKFLTSVKNTSSVLTKEIILPSNVISEFSKTVRSASNQHSLSLLDILVENITECFNSISENSAGSKLLLLVTGELLICFLKEVKLYAPSIVSTTLQALIAKLCIFKGTLQKFGTYLFCNTSLILRNEDIVGMYLTLCFYCGEVQGLVNCYKDSVLPCAYVSASVTDCDWQCCLRLEHWEKLIDFILKSKLESCGSVCFQLALQHLRHCKLENKISSDDNNSTLKIILHQVTSDCRKFNIFQQLPPEDLSIVLELVTKEQSKLICKHVLKQILENDEKEESAKWLSNPVLQENPIFTAALFSAVLNETVLFLREAVPEKNHWLLSWLSEEYFDDLNSAEYLERLPERINLLLRNVKKLRKSSRMKRKDRLIRIMEVFKFLPLHHMKDDFRKLGLSFAVGVGTFLAEEENLVFDSVCYFLASDMDASTCFDIGFCIKWLTDHSGQSDLKVKVIESLVRSSPNMKFGLDQVGRMIDSTETSKCANPLEMLETRVVLYNELGRCWQRAKKRKSDNDLIGSYRTKLAKIISDEARQLQNDTINEGNCRILLKVVAIELNKAIRANEEEEIGNLVDQKFHPYFEFALRKLKKEFDESSAAFLTFILQSLPHLRKFLPEDSFLKIWKVLKAYEKVNWKLFCIHSSEDEFGEVLDDLLKMSKKFLSSQFNKHLSNCFEIWIYFFESSTEPKRNSCQLQLQLLFEYVHECHLLLRDLPIKRKYCLVKFLSFCLTNKEINITSHVLDTVIHVILECLDETPSCADFHDLFTLEVEVASAVLLRQFAWSKSKVHLTFVIFKRMLASLMTRCSSGQVVNKDDVIKLSACAFSLEKWASVMVKKEKDFARTSAYFITALISSIASVTVLPAVKFHLVNSINHFLSISDSHTVAYLMRILKPGYQQVFNTVYNQFKKYHKYSGKI